jgi:hypothetical protein
LKGKSNGNRTRNNPGGDVKITHVGAANLVANRLAVFAAIAWVRGVHIVMENQQTSLFFAYPAVKDSSLVCPSDSLAE